MKLLNNNYKIIKVTIKIYNNFLHIYERKFHNHKY